MRTDRKPIIFTYASIAVVALYAASMMSAAQSEGVMRSGPAVRTAQGQEIPAGSIGIVVIESAREASLLQLRGIAGRGFALLRNSDGNGCVQLPLRFVAGDFGGDGFASTQARPIRLTINDAGIAEALVGGLDIVSDHYHVGTSRIDQIAIVEGLTVEHGFVLNPGKSLLADLLGADVNQVKCEAW